MPLEAREPPRVTEERVCGNVVMCQHVGGAGQTWGYESDFQGYKHFVAAPATSASRGGAPRHASDRAFRVLAAPVVLCSEALIAEHGFLL